MNDASNYVTTAPLRTRLNVHRRFSVNPEGWHRWVLRRLELRPGTAVVDLGCGTGALWEAADPELLERLELVLCDSSGAMLDAARERLAHVPGVRFEHVDLDDEFVLPASPDVVVCNHALYHVRDPSATLARIRDQILVRTRCCFATNGVRNLSELLRLFPGEAAARASALTDRFTLESGHEHVRRVFGGADIVRYADTPTRWP